MAAAVRTCTNPGRGGHPLARRAEETVWQARCTAADFFGWEDPTRVVFTAGCTAALNAVIHGLPPGRAVVSDMEHNAVLRPLKAAGWYVVQADTGQTDEQAVEGFERALREGADLVVCTHASNVTGRVLPVADIAAAAHRRGALFCLDAAQTAGVLPIPSRTVDCLCVPGHKGLHGPMGVGLLLVKPETALRDTLQGGTGVLSRELSMPAEHPEHLEAGTPNVAGIAGVMAGMRYVAAVTPARLYARETSALEAVCAALRDDARFVWYRCPGTGRVPTASFSVPGVPASYIAERLAQAGVAVRAGLHCAPAAHRKIGSSRDGTVRLAPGAAADAAAAEKIAKILQQSV